MTHVYILSYLCLGLHLDESVFIVGKKTILLDDWILKVVHCDKVTPPPPSPPQILTRNW